MEDRFIVSPFFLDEDLPKLESLGQADWAINTPALPDDGQQNRMSVIH